LRDPEAAGDPAAVAARLSADFGLPAATEGSDVVLEADGTRAWAVAHWAVANAKALSITEVQAEGRRWTREARNGWQPAEAAPGQVRITVSGAP
jgi:hypothetical protein